MASQKTAPNPDAEQDTEPQKTPLLQVVLDNPWILLVLGLLIPFISYTAWGWIELSFIEAAQLP